MRGACLSGLGPGSQTEFYEVVDLPIQLGQIGLIACVSFDESGVLGDGGEPIASSGPFDLVRDSGQFLKIAVGECLLDRGDFVGHLIDVEFDQLDHVGIVSQIAEERFRQIIGSGHGGAILMLRHVAHELCGAAESGQESLGVRISS